MRSVKAVNKSVWFVHKSSVRNCLSEPHMECTIALLSFCYITLLFTLFSLHHYYCYWWDFQSLSSRLYVGHACGWLMEGRRWWKEVSEDVRGLPVTGKYCFSVWGPLRCGVSIFSFFLFTRYCLVPAAYVWLRSVSLYFFPPFSSFFCPRCCRNFLLHRLQPCFCVGSFLHMYNEAEEPNELNTKVRQMQTWSEWMKESKQRLKEAGNRPCDCFCCFFLL